ncbi:hypothetical protein FDECE_1510 [Fusarium decemcellulare]|nr:hypothetical protein FDECE_1510 [Fusarium decemcellulare]
MQLTYTAVVLGSQATLASGLTQREFQFPDSVPLSRRQTSGPEYQCHANCGYTILGAEDEGYCDDAEWKELLEGCLKCANTYDMWGDYGEGVKGAAKGCGIDAEPEGASGGSASGTAAATTAVAVTTEATAAETSATAAPTTAAEETSAAAPATTTEEEAATSVVSTPAANNTTAPNATPTSTDSDNAASNLGLSGVLALGAALVAAAGLI